MIDSAIGIALNLEGDIFFENTQLQVVKDQNFTAQNIDERLNTRYAELYFDTTQGIDREELIHSNKLFEIEAIIKSVILSTQTVKKIDSFNLNKNNNTRELDINFGVTSIFNDTFKSEINI